MFARSELLYIPKREQFTLERRAIMFAPLGESSPDVAKRCERLLVQKSDQSQRNAALASL